MHRLSAIGLIALGLSVCTFDLGSKDDGFSLAQYVFCQVEENYGYGRDSKPKRWSTLTRGESDGTTRSKGNSAGGVHHPHN
jgi:hypothetical protein